MADQAGGGAIQRPGQAVGEVRGVGGLARDRMMEGDGGVVESVQMGVDGVMVAVQQIEAGLDARFDQTELREVVAALDPVVAVQMAEEGLQRRSRAACRPRGSSAPERQRAAASAI